MTELLRVLDPLLTHHKHQISTCSGLSAIEHANSKFSKGYSTTGVVCTTCAHEFVLPEGAGQLQKGERFVLTISISYFSTHTSSGMQMLITSLFAAHAITPNRRRSRHTTSCASGPRISVSGCKNSLSTMPNSWTIKLSLGWSRSFTSQPIV